CRLLAVDVFTCLHRGFKMRRMKEDGSGDEDSIDAGQRQQLIKILVGLCLVGRGDSRLGEVDAVGIDVAHGDEAAARIACHVATDVAAAPSGADDAESYSRVGLIAESGLRLDNDKSGRRAGNGVSSGDLSHMIWLSARQAVRTQDSSAWHGTEGRHEALGAARPRR